MCVCVCACVNRDVSVSVCARELQATRILLFDACARTAHVSPRMIASNAMKRAEGLAAFRVAEKLWVQDRFDEAEAHLRKAYAALPSPQIASMLGFIAHEKDSEKAASYYWDALTKPLR